MLRHLPKFSYCGLTIVLSNPSRFDTQELLSAVAGFWFGKECLAPECNRHQCEIRTRHYKGPLLLGTKCVLLMGEDAAHDWLPELRDNKIGEVRGSCYLKDGVIHIPTFVAQDACDMKDYEGKLNPLLQEEGGNTRDWIDNDDGDVKGATAEKRRHGVTSRSNYRFWIRNDVKKALKIIYEHDGKIPNLYPNSLSPNYIIYPNSNDVLNALLQPTGAYLDFDMETFGNLDMSCFSFSFGDSNDIYVVPIRDGTFQLAYDNLTICHILRALALAISRNTLVAHNGSGFDYYVLAKRYGIPIGRRVFDTMLAWHRMYPEIEKSLGHVISALTYENFHKDEGTFNYGSPQQAMNLWRYCGKDVWTMKLIRREILRRAAGIKGMMASIEQVMASIRPYLITTLTGIRYKQDRIISIMSENDRMMTQHLRFIKLLVGEVFLPTSPPQCINYFHKRLGYPVVGRTKTGAPSLGEKQMLQLRLKQENPVIDTCLAYRQTAKESGSLKFLPFKETDNII